MTSANITPVIVKHKSYVTLRFVVVNNCSSCDVTKLLHLFSDVILIKLLDVQVLDEQLLCIMFTRGIYVW